MTNISQSFTQKMAAKINWHKYGTKLRHCHPIYTELYDYQCAYTGDPLYKSEGVETLPSLRKTHANN